MISPDYSIKEIEEIQGERPEIMDQMSVPCFPADNILFNQQFEKHFQGAGVVNCDSLSKHNTQKLYNFVPFDVPGPSADVFG